MSLGRFRRIFGAPSGFTNERCRWLLVCLGPREVALGRLQGCAPALSGCPPTGTGVPAHATPRIKTEMLVATAMNQRTVALSQRTSRLGHGGLSLPRAAWRASLLSEQATPRGPSAQTDMVVYAPPLVCDQPLFVDWDGSRCLLDIDTDGDIPVHLGLGTRWFPLWFGGALFEHALLT